MAIEVPPTGPNFQQHRSICLECLGVDKTRFITPSDLSAFTFNKDPEGRDDIPHKKIATAKWHEIHDTCQPCIDLKCFLEGQFAAQGMEYPHNLHLDCELNDFHDAEDLEKKHGRSQFLTYRLWGNGEEMQEASFFASPEAAGCSCAGQFADLGQAKSWLRLCQDHHESSCGHLHAETKFPLTVINCSQRKLVKLPEGSKVHYACLSYVWGHVSSINEVSDRAAFPKTIEDAIFVTKQLGLQYLWVDRYCIDATNVSERHFLISNMDAIYTQAALTIFAVTGTNPHAGLPGVNGTVRPHKLQNAFPAGIVGYLNPTVEISLSKWASRGWTYQEWVLSRRRLVFTHTQMYYQCKIEHVMEGLSASSTELVREAFWNILGMHGRRFHGSNLALPEGSIERNLHDVYAQIVDYFPRDLTLPSDVINAFLGVLKTSVDRPLHAGSATHFYGLPVLYDSDGSSHNNTTLSFIISLSWCITGYGSRAVSATRCQLFPSWSWARDMTERQRANGPHANGKELMWQLQDGDFHAPDTAVHVEHRDGCIIDISTYAEAWRSFEDFLPHIYIGSRIASCQLGKNSSGNDIVEDMFEGAGYAMLDPPGIAPTGSLVLIFLGASKDKYCISLVLILAEHIAADQYRRVGSISYEKRPPYEPSRDETWSLYEHHCTNESWEHKRICLV